MIDDERKFWDGHATSDEAAKSAIAADESAWSGEILEKCLEQIVPLLRTAPHRKGKRARILDLGCGSGRLAIPLAEREYGLVEVTGVDISQGMLDLAEERRRLWPVQLPNLGWLLCDGRALPAELGRIDAAYSMIMMQHIPRKAQAAYLYEVGRALVRGGIFRFQVLEGTGASFMHHEVNEEYLTHACEAAKFKITALDRVPAFNGSTEVKVLWVTAVKT